jgi:hypothetical protein
MVAAWPMAVALRMVAALPWVWASGMDEASGWAVAWGSAAVCASGEA